MPQPPPQTQKPFAATVWLLVCLALVPVANAVAPPLLAWLLTLALLVVFTALCGQATSGRLSGALIDDRNVMSLARFQMMLWTLLVLSGFVSAALIRVFNGVDNPLAIPIQGELWTLMGISTASLVGSPLLLGNKATQSPDDKEAKRSFELLKRQGDSEQTLDKKGLLVVNTDPSKARFSDMFTGEEVANAAQIDVSRMQMLLFTMVTVIAFAAKLGAEFVRIGAGAGTGAEFSMPYLDASMLALIGISHGGYLVAKGQTQSRLAPPSP
ncbi:MAG: hypothetical protein IT509_01935 [Rhodocyclaceae bacterium]|nr:hypothetical protein [Rhodocyclaceae bacterium]